ncbi:MAG TPA: hypothetical protein VKT70_02665 [Stellaceae bacterium]|nr:hypothetical protein [Stellaceae bacterium]
MILTEIPPSLLPLRLAAFARGLTSASARAVFRRIAIPANATRAEGARASRHHAEALVLLSSFGMAHAPGGGFSWDGVTVRSDTEAYVLLHELAHFQLSPQSRRCLIDFGLGAGPDTHLRAQADEAACLFGAARDREEALASLLGILWEVELGHPALASFLDQNWLEGGERACRHFEAALEELNYKARFAAMSNGYGRRENDDRCWVPSSPTSDATRIAS